MLEEANGLYDESKYEEAAQSFEYLVRTAEQQYGDNPQVLFKLGRCQAELSQWDKAVEKFEKTGGLLMRLGDDADEELTQQTFLHLGKAQF